jgi:hypothetical protein
MSKISREIGNADLLALDVRIHSQKATKGPEFTFHVHTAVCVHQNDVLESGTIPPLVYSDHNIVRISCPGRPDNDYITGYWW